MTFTESKTVEALVRETLCEGVEAGGECVPETGGSVGAEPASRGDASGRSSAHEPTKGRRGGPTLCVSHVGLRRSGEFAGHAQETTAPKAAGRMSAIYRSSVIDQEPTYSTSLAQWSHRVASDSGIPELEETAAHARRLKIASSPGHRSSCGART